MSEGSGDPGFEYLTEFIALLHIFHVSVIKYISSSDDMMLVQQDGGCMYETVDGSVFGKWFVNCSR